MGTRILAFAGSTRAASLNKRLRAAASALAREAGFEVTELDLVDYPMPVYDGDLEARDGLPEGARRLKALMIEHPAFLIASPEYNSSVPGGLKNAIDWVSRADPGEKPGTLPAFRRKRVALLAASPGRLGGLRGLGHLREIFSNLGAVVVPGMVAVGGAAEAFTADGALKDPATAQRVRALLAGLRDLMPAE